MQQMLVSFAIHTSITDEGMTPGMVLECRQQSTAMTDSSSAAAMTKHSSNTAEIASPQVEQTKQSC
jgi:hypothetical protein